MTAPRPAEVRPVVTRADVARYAGVSSAVVSYVVNNGPKPVAPATAARVRDAIDVLGYRPNLSARALKRGTTQMLGLVLHDSSNPFFASFALEITDEAARRGYVVLVINSRSDVEERRALDDLVGRQIDGVIVASTRPETFGLSTSFEQSSGAADRLGGPGARLPESRTRLARRGPDGGRPSDQVHGHTSIGMLVGNDGANVDRREEGWQDALRAAGLPDGPIAGVRSAVRAATRAAGGCLGPAIGRRRFSPVPICRRWVC